MRVLALDTTGRAGSIALVEDGRVVAERSGDPSRTHGERLPGEITALLERHQVELSSIDLFAVAAGPGSFTGLRIGIATMQGLALVTKRGLMGVSALEAFGQLASRHVPEDQLVAPWIDAQRGDVFSALYRAARAPLFSPARLIEIEPPRVGGPAATLAAWSDSLSAPVTFVGDGAIRYRDIVAARGVVLAPLLLAGAVGCIATVRADLGQTAHPAAIHPLYVRRPDAEVDRDKKKALHHGGH